MAKKSSKGNSGCNCGNKGTMKVPTTLAEKMKGNASFKSVFPPLNLPNKKTK